jgi:amino acid adenylation domain-containing protein
MKHCAICHLQFAFFNFQFRMPIVETLVSQMASIAIEEIAERSTDRIDPGSEREAQPAVLPLRRREQPGPAPLSFAQKRLWFLDQINPGDVSSNIVRAVRVGGALDIEKLNQAATAVVSRHESLRTTFARYELRAGFDGQPMQLIKETGSVRFSVVDLSHLPESDREQRARRIARDEAQRPFDLTLGPLLRLTLLKLERFDSVLLLATHRIVCDELSAEIFFDELWECYRAFVSNERVSLAALALQYADYATWQRDTQQDEALKTKIDYWKTKLADAPLVIDLPTDRPRPAVQSWHGASEALVFSQELTAGLRVFCEREDVTLFELILAAFQILLARYSRQTDLVVGSTVANREFTVTQRLIGPFANSLILRNELSGNPTLRQLLERVRRVVRETQSNQSVPFEKLVDELSTEHSLSHAPIFQVVLNLVNSDARITEVADLRVEPFEFESGISPLDLTLEVTVKSEQLHCSLDYSTDLFDAATIKRMLGHLQRLLTAGVANPEQRIEQLPLLTESERQQIILEWNETEKAYPGDRCIHELFESQAAATPEAIAVECAEAQLTYAELNRRANQLAHYLRKLGVRPEKRVGICLSRSPEMLVAVLGILKAGGAYVPLDPAYPKERLAFMLTDAQAKVLLTEEALSHLLPETEHVVCLDSTRDAIEQCDSNNPLNLTSEANLAYVIYTSGSTGKPKGVAIQHCSTVAFLHWAKETFSPRELEGVLASTSLCFDLSVFELFAPLCSGGKTIIVENALSLPSLKSANVTLINTVPSAMVELVQQDGIPTSVRTINLAGEPLRNSLVQEIYKRSGVERVLNLYGPSEDTTYSTFVQTEREATSEPTIGGPIANSRCYILDSHLEPLPVGVPGELYLGGAGLARCYLDRSELTAASFIPDPFIRQAGARLYRTGDLARYQADGNIQFLRRIDHQVKVRGFRIELGEIETVLRSHPSVRDVVVLPSAGNDALVAFVVVNSELIPQDGTLASTLRSHAATKLPEYMSPTLFVPLDSLPLTPNGKIDRRALSISDGLLESSDQIAPRNELEANLAKIWEKVLDRNTVGIRDNFFEIGGHSLLAARLFAQIENRFGRNLPLATLFQAPTVEQLAAVLSSNGLQKEWSSLVAIQPEGSRPPLFCVHAAGANVLIYRPLARHLGSDQPVYAFQARGLDGHSEPYVTVEDMAAHYLGELRAFQPHGPYYLLGASFGGLVAFEMAQRLLAQGQQVGLLALLNTNCPFYSPVKRVRCHLGHLKERGARNYFKAGRRAVARRLGRKLAASDQPAVADRGLQEAIESAPNHDDPLVRTVLANLRAENDYVPARRAYPGKITFFRARDAETDYEDNRAAWAKVPAEAFELHEIPGNHTTMREEPNVAVLVEKLKQGLA